MKKILITGAGGFLGVALLQHCLSKGKFDLWAVTSNEGKLRKCVGNNVHILDRDYPFSEEFKMQTFDCAINCAYPRNTSGEEIARGLKYLTDMFNAFNKGNVKSIINISSQSLYDEKRIFPATEETKLCLNNSYAVGKYATELLLDNICTTIAHTNIRMASLIGPTFNQRIVNRLIQKAINQENIVINKSKQTFGFLDVRDAADGIISLLDIEAFKWKHIYNLGSGCSYSLEDIIKTIKSVFEDDGVSFPEVEFVETSENGSTAVAYDLFYNDTGFKPQVSLSQSIQIILDSLK